MLTYKLVTLKTCSSKENSTHSNVFSLFPLINGKAVFLKTIKNSYKSRMIISMTVKNWMLEIISLANKISMGLTGKNFMSLFASQDFYAPRASGHVHFCILVQVL